MSNQQQSLLIRYRYDALDRLTSHSQLDGVDAQSFYCASYLVTEVKGDEHVSIVQHGDQALAQQKRHDGDVVNTLLAPDHQRSVLNALQESCPQAIAYSPYGHRVFGRGLGSLLGFNGQRPDPVTGHYLLGNGYRAFNPMLMRFNSPDNLSPFGKGGVNAYAYCQGDPINRSDPTGHFFSALSQYLSKVSAMARSFDLGIKLKAVKNVTRLSEGIYTFEDVYKGRSRLTFDGHYFQGEVGEGFSVLELHDLARRQGVDVQKYDYVRMVICHSADVEKNIYGIADISFAEGFSQLAKRPVKAYEGVVGAINTGGVFEDLKVGETYAGPYYFGIAKDAGALVRYGAQYRPVHFAGLNRLNTNVRGD
jgi:RHS repeat-associated protein